MNNVLMFALVTGSGLGGNAVIDHGHQLLSVTQRAPIEMRYSPASDDISGGNTSFRNERASSLAWKGSPDSNGFGYFQRNRDLGQTFWTPNDRDVRVNALVLRTGRGANAVMAGAPGSPIYVQWFEVGRAANQPLRIDDNGTPLGTKATHGFDQNLHRCDDVVRGETYRSIHVSRPAPMPAIPPTNRDGYLPANRQPGHLRYFEIRFDGPDQVVLRRGRQYAFVVGFLSPGTDRGIGLANQQWVHRQEPPAFLLDPNGRPRWGIRREGNGLLPPIMTSSSQPPTDRAQLRDHIRQSMSATRHWNSLMPTSDGYPDVDTYRTLEFCVVPAD